MSSVNAKGGILWHEEAFSELVALLTEPIVTYRNKLACPLFRQTRFRPGADRCDADVVECWGAEGDHDAGTMTPAEAARLMREVGVRCTIYTTASHTEAKPRWRIVVPFGQAVTPPERSKWLDYVNAVLRGALARESWNKSTFFYYGRVEGVQFLHYDVPGARIPDSCIETVLDPLPFAGSAPADTVERDRTLPALPGGVDVPALLPAPPVVEGLDAVATRILSGDTGDQDRSAALASATAGLLRALAAHAEPERAAFTVLAYNDWAFGVALDHRQQDASGALEYLWKHHVTRQRHIAHEADTLFEALPDVFVAPGATKLTDLPLPPFQRTRGGEILPTLSNIVRAAERPDIIGVHLAYDTFRDQTTIVGPGATSWRNIQDHDLTGMRLDLEVAGFQPIGKETMRDAVHFVARKFQFDSAQKWLATLKWDGVPRIERFCCDYLGADDTPYTRQVALYLWTALAGRVITPGIKTDMVPVLVGAQGMRKSTAVAALVPEPDFYTELSFSEHDDNLSRKMRGLLVGELAELKGLRSREAEAIKAWITKTHERWTPKYQEFEATFARRCVFVGTTNESDFLDDSTGNRRWLPVTVVRQCDTDAISRDRDQLWAEARDLFAVGGVQFREAESLAVTEHDAFTTRDEWADVIAPFLADKTSTTTNEVMQEVGLSISQRGMREQKRIGRVLRGLGWEDYTTARDADGRRRKMWRRA